METFESFKNMIIKEITSLKEDLSNSLNNSKNEIIEKLQNENKELQDKVLCLENLVSSQEELIIDMERDICEVQQYQRRNNVEITGIPESIKQHELESKVIELANVIDVKITRSDI